MLGVIQLAPIIVAIVPYVALTIAVAGILWLLYQSMNFEGMPNAVDGSTGLNRYTDALGQKNLRGFKAWLVDGLPHVTTHSSMFSNGGFPWWIWLVLALVVFRKNIYKIFK